MNRTLPVTVVIPAWQAGPYLRGTLESLRQQTSTPAAEKPLAAVTLMVRLRSW